MGSKLVDSFPPWPLLQVLLPAVQVPALVSPSDELGLGHVNERNPFLPEFLLAMVFIVILECELGWCSKINKADIVPSCHLIYGLTWKMIIG